MRERETNQSGKDKPTMRIDNWADIDAALRELGEIDLELGLMTAGLAIRLRDAILESYSDIESLKTRRLEIEMVVDEFCAMRKDEFAKKRSKVLVFGKIAYRVAERIEFDSVLESAVIATLRKLGHIDCINVRENVDKSAVKVLDDAELARCGIRRRKEDHFRVEPNLKMIAETIGRDCPVSTPGIDMEKIIKLIPDVSGGK